MGKRVSMNSDGTRIVVGAPNTYENSYSGVGSAYIFLRTGYTWTQEAKLLASDKEEYDTFGSSVAISGDGTRVIVGSPNSEPIGGALNGAAYIFTRTGVTWTQAAQLSASDKAANDIFGDSVSIAGDGTRAIVGATMSDPSGVSGAGSVYIFK